LGEPKSCQVKDDKILIEDPSSTIVQRMPNLLIPTLIWKGEEEGRRGSTISFQSKETILEIGWGILKESGMLPLFRRY
jgi:hypothetical protein